MEATVTHTHTHTHTHTETAFGKLQKRNLFLSDQVENEMKLNFFHAILILCSTLDAKCFPHIYRQKASENISSRLCARTRMYSSRMLTACSLTISHNIWWGVCCQTPIEKQTPLLDADPPPGCRLPLWTEWLTDRCKNITFANFVCGW